LLFMSESAVQNIFRFVVGCHMKLLNQIINWHLCLVVQSSVLKK